ncbi:hypothetical protein TRFO_26900 [Tritrichomonas foetus]|uniref:Uncharacterized protein n=1 Tax=Tritrichomonas foetus TaxID=1144522 RepID=A0A1J4K7L9_9EUKA|nr:hypothetical protein TRFO_26900 [Tritrichomonas foetus]|eukprot:OHT05413.1 hypothetical protein TRFO_26900 [Tritrichomonas foetus]
MLADSAIRELASGKGGTYIFDLSDIDEQFYEPLLRTLQKFIPKNVESLGFNCDHLQDARRSANSGEPFPQSILRSIAKNRKHFIRNIVELLYHVIPRSTKLKTLKLSNIEFQLDQINRIAEAISKSVSFENLHFNRIPLGDEGLQAMIKRLDSNQIRSLSLLFCEITRKSTPILVNFAKSRTSTGKGISKIDLSSQEIPQKDIVRIQQALKISGTPSPKKTLGSPKKESLKGSPKGSTNGGKYEALKRENQELKAELERLRSSVKTAQYNERVFVIGRGAEQFVRFLNEIESKLHDLEEQRSQMTSFV